MTLHPLGRLVHHDPKSRAYPFKAARGTNYRTVQHASHIDILDQGQIGSCTGNATVGALGCDPFYATLPATVVLDEAQAVRVYSLATQRDEFDGWYNIETGETDTGSSGLGAAKAAKEFGYISGYRHAFSVADALAALQDFPIIAGIPWYSSFEEPDANGVVAIGPTAYVRGGHEICGDGYDADKGLVWFRNSWGPMWGKGGRFAMQVATFARLLSEDGDVTVFTPLTAPTPVPLPTVDPELAAWWTASKAWANARHVGSNAAAARAAKALAQAKGL